MLEGLKKDVWQITGFAKEVNRLLNEKYPDKNFKYHYNTVDNWFKEIEEKRIHYINRTIDGKGEKIYDKQDLYIACFIGEARKDNLYKLEVILDQITKQPGLEVRPFPEEFEDNKGLTINEKALQAKILDETNSILAKQIAIYEEKMNAKIDRVIDERVEARLHALLPAPQESSKEEKREEEFTRIRVEFECEDAALREWSKLPDSERMKKVGLFRKEEDLIKRETFVRDYKKKHLHRMLEEAYKKDDEE